MRGHRFGTSETCKATGGYGYGNHIAFSLRLLSLANSPHVNFIGNSCCKLHCSLSTFTFDSLLPRKWSLDLYEFHANLFTFSEDFEKYLGRIIVKAFTLEVIAKVVTMPSETQGGFFARVYVYL